ncbi:threonine aldolase family protein [Mycoplasma sp. P36-A1]|uniref:threonine aldolase family protein n=1 Tax=Mycoplasma sp. P36-A1 TaxID=3252900 RepID=UPI003C2AB560
MYSFESDYSEGAHPNILKAMVQANLDQTSGYGFDSYTEKATEILKDKLQNNNVDIHFFVGGTITNLTALSSFLRPHEAIICTDEGHIATHEAGAIEATGHKVIAIENTNGKLDPIKAEKEILKHEDFHMVKPKCLYISNATELGTTYTKAELLELRSLADKYNMILYMDGARLANALVAENNDVTLEDLCNIFDMFYIGATKNGALFGEALVIVNDKLKPEFKYICKQKGTIYVKNKFLAIQFIELFTNDLYFKLALHANTLARKLEKSFVENGFEIFIETNANQLFVIIENEVLEEFEREFSSVIWGPYNENKSLVRYTTSWATKEGKVEEFIKLIEQYKR